VHLGYATIFLGFATMQLGYATIFLGFAHTTLCLNQDLLDLWICRIQVKSAGRCWAI